MLNSIQCPECRSKKNFKYKYEIVDNTKVLLFHCLTCDAKWYEFLEAEK